MTSLPKGLDIPQSLRDECGCCKGEGTHEGCTPVNPIECEACGGYGKVLNRLGHDLLKFLYATGVIQEGTLVGVKDDIAT